MTKVNSDDFTVVTSGVGSPEPVPKPDARGAIDMVSALKISPSTSKVRKRCSKVFVRGARRLFRLQALETYTSRSRVALRFHKGSKPGVNTVSGSKHSCV